MSPIALLYLSGSFVALALLSTEQSPDFLAWHLCPLQSISCCSPNCSMFQADCAPCRCPSPVCALFPLGLRGMPSLSSPSVTFYLCSRPSSSLALSQKFPLLRTSIVLGSYGSYGICCVLIHALLFMTCVSLLPY